MQGAEERSEGQEVVAFLREDESEPVSVDAGGDGARGVDEIERSAELRVVVVVVEAVGLGVDGGEREDGRVGGDLEDGQCGELGSGPELLDGRTDGRVIGEPPSSSRHASGASDTTAMQSR